MSGKLWEQLVAGAPLPLLGLDGAGAAGAGIARRYRDSFEGWAGLTTWPEGGPVHVIVWRADDGDAAATLPRWAEIAETDGRRDRDIGLCLGDPESVTWPARLVVLPAAATDERITVALDALIRMIRADNLINLRHHELFEVLAPGCRAALLCATGAATDGVMPLLAEVMVQWARPAPPVAAWIHISQQGFPRLSDVEAVLRELRRWMGDGAVLWVGATENPHLAADRLRLTVLGPRLIKSTRRSPQ